MRGVLRAIVAVALIVLAVVIAIVIAIARRRGGAVGGAAATSKTALPLAIEWPPPAPCLPPGAVAAAVTAAKSVSGFGPVDAAGLIVLEGAAADINKRFGTALTKETLASIRTMERATAARSSGIAAMRVAPELVAALSAGTSGAESKGAFLVELAERHRLPPVAVLRAVMIERGVPPSRVRAMLAGREPFPEDLAAAAEAAAEADLGSARHGARIREASRAFENEIATWLRKQGARFVTEDAQRVLHAAQISDATPDFVFDPPVKIVGRAIHWLDAKNYAWYGSKLVSKSLAKQARKYNKAFGPGAMAFRGGLLCDKARWPGEPPLLLEFRQN